MNIFTAIYKYLGGSANTQSPGVQNSSPSSSAHDDSPLIGVDVALQVSTVWACVNLKVETLSSLPLNIYQSDKDDNRVLIKTGRLYDVLHRSPNRHQTSQEFWEQMNLNYELRGNSYARIVRDNKGDVMSLWPLSADQMSVIVLDSGKYEYRYRFDNKETIYKESDILHIRGMGNGVVGMSPLDYMRSSVGLGVKAQNHTAKTLNKNARRPGTMMIDSVVSPDQRRTIKNEFRDIVSGSNEELYLLEAGLKFEPLGMSPADIQLLETRKFSVQDLARWFGVPSVLINDTGESTALGSSVSQLIDAFHRLKLRPQIERIEQAIVKRVLSPKQRAQNINVEFNFDALLRASLKERLDVYSKGVQNAIYTRNECRKYEKLPAMPGGDVLTAQVNLMPLDQLGTQTKQAGSVPPETVEQ